MSSEPTTAEAAEDSTGLPIAIGAPIPSVGLRASDGYLLNLRSFVGRQHVALLFFAGPTAEGAKGRRGERVADSLAAAQRRFETAGIAVVGITCDNERQQAEWIAARSFPYLLFSDERRTAVSILGIPLSHDGENHNVERPWILVVAPDGLMRAVLRDPEPEYAADVVLAAVRRADGLDDDRPDPRDAAPPAGSGVATAGETPNPPTS